MIVGGKNKDKDVQYSIGPSGRETLNL